MPVKSNYRCMYKLNFITIVGIVASVSLVVGMASPAAAFAAQHENMTMNMDNMSSMGNMTGGNATSMAGNMTETESMTTAGETGLDDCPGEFKLEEGGCDRTTGTHPREPEVE